MKLSETQYLLEETIARPPKQYVGGACFVKVGGNKHMDHLILHDFKCTFKMIFMNVDIYFFY